MIKKNNLKETTLSKKSKINLDLMNKEKHKKKSISVIIVNTLLIVVAVIIVVIILNFGADFTTSKINRTDSIVRSYEVSNVDFHLVVEAKANNQIQIRNTSSKNLKIVGYSIISKINAGLLNKYIDFEEQDYITLNAGGTIVLPIECYPEPEFNVEILFEDNSKSVKQIKTNNFDFTRCLVPLYIEPFKRETYDFSFEKYCNDNCDIQLVEVKQLHNNGGWETRIQVTEDENKGINIGDPFLPFGLRFGFKKIYHPNRIVESDDALIAPYNLIKGPQLYELIFDVTNDNKNYRLNSFLEVEYDYSDIKLPAYKVYSNYNSGSQFTDSLEIILSSDANEIYYTTNGEYPDCNGVGTLYENPILVTDDTTIKATGCAEEHYNRINEFIYNKIKLPAYQIYSNYTSGTYYDFSLEIILSSEADEIYYTINGETPNCSGVGQLYIEPINLTTGTTNLQAASCAEGHYTSIYSFAFVLPEITYIYTADDLHNIRNDLYGYYVLANDIDLNVSPYNSGDGWVPISDFFGTLDGNGHTINNLSLTGSGIGVGLFKLVSSSGNIKNIRLDNAYVKSEGAIVGGLVGRNYGDISNSSVNGYVSGRFGTGGLVGKNYSSGKISSCFTNGVVSSVSSAGGLVGFNDGLISNSYSLSDVISLASSTEIVYGGFVSNNSGTINNSYSIGRVIYEDREDPTDKGFSSNSVSATNYWDVNTSLQTTSGGGAIGKTTQEMKTQNTFVGWDFTDIWAIDLNVNNGYPYLRNNSN